MADHLIRQSDVSIDHMIDDRAFEPQRQSHSYIQIDLSDVKPLHGEADTLGSLTENKFSSLGNYGSTLLRLALKSHSMPNHSGSEIVIRKGNEEIKFNGGETYENLDIAVDDFIGADTEYMIASWDALRYNPVTGFNACAADYKKPGTIVQYSPDGKIIRTWALKGCWVNNVKYGDYSRESDNGTREISFTLHIDKAYPEVRTTRQTNI